MSAFTFLERLGVEAQVAAGNPLPPELPYPLQCRAVAAWLKQPDDAGKKFSVSLSLNWLGKTLVHPGETFAFAEDKHLHRSTFVVNAGLPMPTGPETTIWVRATLHPDGSTEPLAMVEYPLYATMTIKAAPIAPQSGQ